MQQIDLTEFANSSGWHVIHDSNTLQYLIKSSNGKTRPGSWTHKRFADKALRDYLLVIQKTTHIPPKGKRNRDKTNPVIEATE
jgi:hypothetical protein